MNVLPRFVFLGLLLLLLGACGRPAPVSLQQEAFSADADVPTLLAHRDTAAQRARTAAAQVVLRQVDVDPTLTLFRFTDKHATQEITVVAPQAELPASQWDVVTNTVSPLVGHTAADLPLHELVVGPAQATDVLFQQWPECRAPRATLFLDEGVLTWRTFCTIAAGVVSGKMDARSGTFTLDPVSPGLPPPTSPSP